MQLSEHFKARWLERVGDPIPSPEEVAGIVKASKYVNWCKDFVDPRTGRKFRMLAIYVDHARGIAIKVDTINGVAVTVI